MRLFQGRWLHHFCRKNGLDRLLGNLNDSIVTGAEVAKDNPIRVEHRYDFDDVVAQKLFVVLPFSNKLSDEPADYVRATGLTRMDST